METELIFKRVGNYSMGQANDEDCYICKNADFGDVLVKSNSDKYVCVKCLLHHYDSTKGLYATDKKEYANDQNHFRI